MSKKVLTVCTLGQRTGYGHLTRCKTLIDYIKNKEIKFSLLKLEDHKKNIEKIIYKKDKDFRPQIIIFDLGKNFLKPSLLGLIKKLKEEKYILIGIDNLKIYYNYLDPV